MTMELKKHFITTERPYREGAVEVFEQNIPHVSARKAVLTITALGVYEAQINGEKIGPVIFHGIVRIRVLMHSPFLLRAVIAVICIFPVCIGPAGGIAAQYSSQKK